MSALRRTSHKPCRRMQRQHSRAAPVTMGFVHQMPPNRKAPALSHGGFNILNRPFRGAGQLSAVGRGRGCCTGVAIVCGQNNQQQRTGCNCATTGKTGTGCEQRSTIVALDAATCANAVNCFDLCLAGVDLAVATLYTDRVFGVAGITQNSSLSCCLC